METQTEAQRPVYVGEMTNGALLAHLQKNHEWEYSYEDHGTDPNVFEIHARIDHRKVADHDHRHSASGTSGR